MNFVTHWDAAPSRTSSAYVDGRVTTEIAKSEDRPSQVVADPKFDPLFGCRESNELNLKPCKYF